MVETKKSTLVGACVLVGALSIASVSFAGTGGAEFSDIFDTLMGWSKGFLGKTIAIATFLVGIGMGVTRQSLMAIATGVGSAIGIYFTPDIIEGIMTALM